MVVEATLEDLPEIRELLKSSHLPSEDISMDNQQFWLYKASNEIHGICGMEQFGSFALLRSFAVKSQLQNKGIGKILYQSVIDNCISIGIRTIYLLTTTASNYFSKLGWIKIARNAVPYDVQKSNEFCSICPQTADCMMLLLGNVKNKSAIEKFF